MGDHFSRIYINTMTYRLQRKCPQKKKLADETSGIARNKELVEFLKISFQNEIHPEFQRKMS